MSEERKRETIRRVYKYRAYPSKSQVETLEAQLGFCCDLYNAVLQLRREGVARARSFAHARGGLKAADGSRPRLLGVDP